MIIDIQTFLDRPGVFIDVRSPGEFAQGHIPGSINIPLFSNEERAVVGTSYKKRGREEAVMLGFEIVGPKLASFAAQAKEHIGKGLAKVYCWRGGMRSSSMGWLMQTAGLKTCTLQSGYKAFRRWVLLTLSSPRPIALIGGLTGSGKTEVLHKLGITGQQVLDLEALAKHRGSSYGMMDLQQQPSNEQFENEIALRWQTFDSKRPVWIEDESRMIGQCKIPDSFFTQMRASPLFIIESPRQIRVQQLLQDYGTLSIPNLIAATKRIERRLGSERTLQVINLLQEKNLESALEILLDYYDKSYIKSLKGRQQPILHLSYNPDSLETWAEKLCDAYLKKEVANVKYTYR